MRTLRFGLVLLAALTLLGLDPAAAPAQEPAQQDSISEEVRAQGRRLQAEARAHVDAQRWALAAQTYRQVYELGREHGVPQAPIALWNVGLALMRIPGHEVEARDAFRLFLDGSTTLTEDAQVRDWRSTALEHIAELDARIGTSVTQGTGVEPADGAAEDDVDGADEAQPASGGGGVSPAGPVVLGLGALVLAAGAVLGGVVLAQDGELAAMCTDGRCPDTARPLVQDQARLALSSDVLVITGAAVALTGLLLTLFLREEAPSPAARGVTAACGPLGCQLSGRF